MTNIADNIQGQAPSLLPTGRQGNSGESVSILRDLDPRSTKLGASPSYSYRTILLVVAPMAIGATLLAGYLYFESTGEGNRAPARSVTKTSIDGPAISQVAVASAEPSASPAKEGQGPAIILSNPDLKTGDKELPNANTPDAHAEKLTGQQAASMSTSVGKTVDISEHAETSKKAALSHHAEKSSVKKTKPGGGEKKRIEHEIDIVTAIVKSSQN